jgi:outer membrane protein TolC
VKTLQRFGSRWQLVVLTTWLSVAPLFAQKSMDVVFQLPDSVISFSIDEFYKIILEHHPVVKQARLLNEVALQEIRMARGAFDPKLEFFWDKKEFQDKLYYNRRDARIYFPSQFPVNPKVGFLDNRGLFLNPAETIPGDQQLYAGFEFPIGRGLVTDERRAALQQAKLYQNIAAADQIKLINKVLLYAAKDYWSWYHAYYNFRLINQGVTIASEIFRRVRVNAVNGEAAPIDTVQAKITLQTRLVEQQEAILEFRNTGIMVSNYLWDEAGEPIDLSLRIAPMLGPTDVALSLQTISSLTDQARQNHPELVKFRNKIDQLEVDRQLAREWLKPRLDLNYSMLSQPTGPIRVDPLNDYKLGVDFSFPILLRKERSKLELTNLKIRGTEFEQSQTEREIVNEINAVFNEIVNTGVIIRQQGEMVDLYDRLLRAELLNLENGESDLFKINIQQEKLIQSQSKFLKMQAVYEKAKASLYWAAGVRNLNFNATGE